jgi:hypothetical protein
MSHAHVTKKSKRKMQVRRKRNKQHPGYSKEERRRIIARIQGDYSGPSEWE